MAAHNTTVNFLLQRRPDYVGYVDSSGPGRIERLTWKIFAHPTEPQYWNESDLASQLADATGEVQIVPDSSFFPRHELDPALWRSTVQHRVLIPAAVRAELTDWLQTPFSNQGIRDVLLEAER